EFLVVAATLLDLKAARLLPRGEVDDIDDLELLESRDLLFARLLQYRAYKQVADQFAQWQRDARRAYTHAVGMDDQCASLWHQVKLGRPPANFGELTTSVFRPKSRKEVGIGYILQVAVTLPKQAGKFMDVLKLLGAEQRLSFNALSRD